MALQWFAGFEAGNLDEVLAATGNVGVTTSQARSGAYSCGILAFADSTKHYLTIPNRYDSYGRPSLGAQGTYTIGCGLRIQSLPQDPGTWENLLRIMWGSTQRAALRLGQDGTLQLYIDSFTLVATVGPLPVGQWVYFELGLSPAGYMLRLDGQVVAEGSDAPAGTMNLGYLGKNLSVANQAYVVHVDDVYVCDDLTMYGPSAKVLRRNPNGNGTAADWAESAGAKL